MKKKSLIIILTLTVALSVTGFYGHKYISSKTSTENISVSYTSVEVSTQDISKSITGSGQISSNTSETLIASSSKTVTSVDVAANTEVASGTTLITYSDGTTLVAPYDCIVSEILTSADSTVKSGSELMKIYDSKNLTTIISVDEGDIKNVSVGQTAKITSTANEDTEYTGTVTSISPIGSYNNGTSTFDVTIKFDNIENLKIGMSSTAEITIENKEDILSLPISAIKTSDDKSIVLVKDDDGNISNKEITIGIANDSYVEITEGLSEGDTVQVATVTSSSDSSKDSDRSPGSGNMGGSMPGGDMGGGNMGGSSGGNKPSGNSAPSEN